jgi:hypothetical protein
MAEIFAGLGFGLQLVMTFTIVFDKYGVKGKDTGKQIGLLLFALSLSAIIFSNLIFNHYFYKFKNKHLYKCYTVNCYDKSFLFNTIISFFGFVTAFLMWRNFKKNNVNEDKSSLLSGGMGFKA